MTLKGDAGKRLANEYENNRFLAWGGYFRFLSKIYAMTKRIKNVITKYSTASPPSFKHSEDQLTAYRVRTVLLQTGITRIYSVHYII